MRIISLAPSNTEILVALGLGKDLAAVTSYCRLPEVPGSAQPRRLPGWSSIKAGDVLALRPDLVLTSSMCQEGLRAELAQAGCPLFHADPRSLAQVAQSFVAVGELVGKAAAGEGLRQAFDSAIQAFQARSRARRPRVYVEEWDKPPMVAGNWVPEMVLAAGAEPFSRTLGEVSKAITWEELMEFDPEMVIYSICGVGKAFDPQSFMKVEGWNTLSAAKSGRLYSVDDSLFNVPGPGLIRGIQALAEMLEGAGL